VLLVGERVMPASRLIISAVALLLLGALLLACAFGVIPYVIKQKLEAVGCMNIITVLLATLYLLSLLQILTNNFSEFFHCSS